MSTARSVSLEQSDKCNWTRLGIERTTTSMVASVIPLQGVSFGRLARRVTRDLPAAVEVDACQVGECWQLGSTLVSDVFAILHLQHSERCQLCNVAECIISDGGWEREIKVFQFVHARQVVESRTLHLAACKIETRHVDHILEGSHALVAELVPFELQFCQRGQCAQMCNVHIRLGSVFAHQVKSAVQLQSAIECQSRTFTSGRVTHLFKGKPNSAIFLSTSTVK